jgi:hypothetical protein
MTLPSGAWRSPSASGYVRYYWGYVRLWLSTFFLFLMQYFLILLCPLFWIARNPPRTKEALLVSIELVLDLMKSLAKFIATKFQQSKVRIYFHLSGLWFIFLTTPILETVTLLWYEELWRPYIIWYGSNFYQSSCDVRIIQYPRCFNIGETLMLEYLWYLVYSYIVAPLISPSRRYSDIVVPVISQLKKKLSCNTRCNIRIHHGFSLPDHQNVNLR